MRRVKKAVEYRTDATVVSRGKMKSVVLRIQPGEYVAVRLAGERQSHYYPLATLYSQAVLASVEAARERPVLKVKRG